MRGVGATPHPAHGPLLGWGEQEGASSGCLTSGCPSSGCLSSRVGEREGASGCLSAGSYPGPTPPPQTLLRPLCFAARRPVSCPPLSPAYRLSFLDSLGCHRPGWRHRHHKTFPAARELSSPRPPPLALGSRGAWCSLLRPSLLAVSSIPDGGMRRATKDISEFP